MGVAGVGLPAQATGGTEPSRGRRVTLRWYPPVGGVVVTHVELFPHEAWWTASTRIHTAVCAAAGLPDTPSEAPAAVLVHGPGGTDTPRHCGLLQCTLPWWCRVVHGGVYYVVFDVGETTAGPIAELGCDGAGAGRFCQRCILRAGGRRRRVTLRLGGVRHGSAGMSGEREAPLVLTPGSDLLGEAEALCAVPRQYISLSVAGTPLPPSLCTRASDGEWRGWEDLRDGARFTAELASFLITIELPQPLGAMTHVVSPRDHCLAWVPETLSHHPVQAKGPRGTSSGVGQGRERGRGKGLRPKAPAAQPARPVGLRGGGLTSLARADGDIASAVDSTLSNRATSHRELADAATEESTLGGTAPTRYSTPVSRTASDPVRTEPSAASPAHAVVPTSQDEPSGLDVDTSSGFHTGGSGESSELMRPALAVSTVEPAEFAQPTSASQRRVVVERLLALADARLPRNGAVTTAHVAETRPAGRVTSQVALSRPAGKRSGGSLLQALCCAAPAPSSGVSRPVAVVPPAPQPRTRSAGSSTTAPHLGTIISAPTVSAGGGEGGIWLPPPRPALARAPGTAGVDGSTLWIPSSAPTPFTVSEPSTVSDGGMDRSGAACCADAVPTACASPPAPSDTASRREHEVHDKGDAGNSAAEIRTPSTPRTPRDAAPSYSNGAPHHLSPLAPDHMYPPRQPRACTASKAHPLTSPPPPSPHSSCVDVVEVFDESESDEAHVSVAAWSDGSADSPSIDICEVTDDVVRVPPPTGDLIAVTSTLSIPLGCSMGAALAPPSTTIAIPSSTTSQAEAVSNQQQWGPTPTPTTPTPTLTPPAIAPAVLTEAAGSAPTSAAATTPAPVPARAAKARNSASFHEALCASVSAAVCKGPASWVMCATGDPDTTLSRPYSYQQFARPTGGREYTVRYEDTKAGARRGGEA
eukprot:TRINITY_DN5553_c0_g1_i1.p1 TRINITY_DN5553_c0_g1~~TRINITY_DN5553_c0_g1_i1.p1  ORF type:complete len:926 (+),score=-39.65 TRINITY_DN5553_c0_g1_i1:68-2845(+)